MARVVRARGSCVVCLALWLWASVLSVAAQTDGSASSVILTVDPMEATVGQRIEATIVLVLPADATLETPPIGPRLGPFTVFGGAWDEPVEEQGSRIYRWSARLSAFETGRLEIPSLTLGGLRAGKSFELVTQPVAVELTSVLGELSADEPAQIADIKPPVAIPPDYRPLWIALAIVGLLVAIALLLWWLQRRYATRLAAVPIDEDVFRRMPPHEWVYQELQTLLEARMAEQGKVDLFYGELSRILKRYLEGRYRVDLIEHTTEEVTSQLTQAGTPDHSIAKISVFLADCDRVKFARERPTSEQWRLAIEQVYDIVDATKAVEAGAVPGEAEGAA